MGVQSSINQALSTTAGAVALAKHLKQQKESNEIAASNALDAAYKNSQAAQEDLDKMQEGIEYTEGRIKELEPKVDVFKDDQGRYRNSLGQFAKADQALADELASQRQLRLRQDDQLSLIKERKELADRSLQTAQERYAKYHKGGNE